MVINTKIMRAQAACLKVRGLGEFILFVHDFVIREEVGSSKYPWYLVFALIVVACSFLCSSSLQWCAIIYCQLFADMKNIYCEWKREASHGRRL